MWPGVDSVLNGQRAWTVVAGHCVDVLRGMPDSCVHMVVTSPPYWGLRDYGLRPVLWDDDQTCAHRWSLERHPATRKLQARGGVSAAEDGIKNVDPADGGGSKTEVSSLCAGCGAWRGSLGLELTPELYVRHLVDVFREVRRVLRDDGTVWLNLGDCYAGSGGPGSQYDSKAAPKYRSAFKKYPNPNREVTGLKPKDLVGIPWRVAFALQADGWFLRSDCIWAKPNPMPESVKDRPTRAHEYVFLLTKQEKYYYDADGIREPQTGNAHGRGRGITPKSTKPGTGVKANTSFHEAVSRMVFLPSGRNRRSVWTIPVVPYREAHFATFPSRLVEPCIVAGTSGRGVCPQCGVPWSRVARAIYRNDTTSDGRGAIGNDIKGGRDQGLRRFTVRTRRLPATLGWQPNCSCGTPDLLPDELDVILSPSTRSGTRDDSTTLKGRRGLGRPRRPGEGRDLVTRYEQWGYAVQIRDSPHRRQMEREAGSAFEHYVRTDRNGARPVPRRLLETWIRRGWVMRVDPPVPRPLPPTPAVVLDPFIGAGTTAMVARALGRRCIGIDLKPEYVAMATSRVKAVEVGARADRLEKPTAGDAA